jgi:hypothetical protein
MKRILRWSLGLVLIAGFTGVGRSTAAGSPASSTKRYLRITVRVDNRVHMPPDELAGAEQVATQILRQAGVQALWLDCTVTVATHQWQPVCDRPFGQTDLILNFVEEAGGAAFERVLNFRVAHLSRWVTGGVFDFCFCTRNLSS